MEWYRSFRERIQTRRQDDIQHQSEDLITVSDFADSLFIAYQGTPLVPIEDSWTSKEILQKLTEVRQNYVNAKMKEIC